MSVVAFSPQLPCANPNNAGARYVHLVEQSWGSAQRVFFVPDGDSSRRAADGELAPPHRFLGGCPRATKAAHTLRTVLGLVVPVLPSPEFLWGVITDREARTAARSARVVDLQWEQLGVLLPWVRAMNPRARVVCTLHDVLSQRFGRSRDTAGGLLKRARWAWAAAGARLHERLVMRWADVVVVLSEKDRDLLPAGRAEVHVVSPPLADRAPAPARAPRPGSLLFVAALYRWDNAEGLAWFITDILPLIRERVPGVTLRVAGAGAGEELRAVAAAAGVELLEFVEELSPLYAEAAAIVVPLRHGAGTKFKVIDALVAGVPVVTTSVGAEGIGSPELYAGVADDATGLAERVARILENPAPFEDRARSSREWALKAYGERQFAESMRAVYRLGEH